MQEVARRIAEAFRPEKVILFGSGSPTPDSDVDLLVIMDSDERPATRSRRVADACHPGTIAMDILVRTPAELAQRLSINDSFFKEIVQKGRVLYERGV